MAVGEPVAGRLSQLDCGKAFARDPDIERAAEAGHRGIEKVAIPAGAQADGVFSNDHFLDDGLLDREFPRRDSRLEFASDFHSTSAKLLKLSWINATVVERENPPRGSH